MFNKLKKFFSEIYFQMVKMDDSPQHIALGFGVGVFLGILPGTGPIAALAVAALFRINKAAALLGSVLTNAWLSIVTFVLSIKIGCKVLNVDIESVMAQADGLIKHFSWKAFFDASLVNIIKPLMIGYMIVGFACGVVAYGLVLLVLLGKKKP